MASDAATLTRALHDVANWTVPLVIHEGGHDWAWWQQAMLDDVTGFLNGKAYGDLDGERFHTLLHGLRYCQPLLFDTTFSSGMAA